MKQRLAIFLSTVVLTIAAILYIQFFHFAKLSFVSLLQGIVHPDDNYMKWFPCSAPKNPKGVALVIHGLNLKPDKMESIIAPLNDAGIDVLNVSLRGHGSNYFHLTDSAAREDRLASFKEVTYAVWINEAYAAYLKVLLRARKNAVPVFFIGYSLGGLLGVDLLACKPSVHFDRMVLFAPALAVQPMSYHLKPLIAFPNLVIDSESPETYRANDGTPVAGYNALFDAIEDFEEHISEKLNVPTLVFIDENDEFVSYQNLKDIINDNKLDQWQVIDVHKDNGTAEGIAHHMIIDEQCMGKAMWKQMREITLRHLRN